MLLAAAGRDGPSASTSGPWCAEHRSPWGFHRLDPSPHTGEIKSTRPQNGGESFRGRLIRRTVQGAGGAPQNVHRRIAEERLALEQLHQLSAETDCEQNSSDLIATQAGKQSTEASHA